MNRWTVPTIFATVLSVPAVLLGWNASAIASTVTEPWRAQTTVAGPDGPQVVGANPRPVTTPAVVAPTSAPVKQRPVSSRVPASEARRTVVVVHSTIPSPGDNEEDDVSTTDETPSRDQRGNDSGAPPLDGPIDSSDPAAGSEDPNLDGDNDPTTSPGDSMGEAPPSSNEPPSEEKPNTP